MALFLMDEIELQIRKVRGVIGVSFHFDDEERAGVDLIVTPANLVSEAEGEVRRIFQQFQEGVLDLNSVGIPPIPKDSVNPNPLIFKELFPSSIRLASLAKEKELQGALDKGNFQIAVEANGTSVAIKKSISSSNSVVESLKQLIKTIMDESLTPDVQRSSNKTEFADDNGPLNTSERSIALPNGTTVSLKRVEEFLALLDSCKIKEAIVEPEVSYLAKVIVSSANGDDLGVSKSYVKEDAEALATLHAMLRTLNDFS